MVLIMVQAMLMEIRTLETALMVSSKVIIIRHLKTVVLKVLIDMQIMIRTVRRKGGEKADLSVTELEKL